MYSFFCRKYKFDYHYMVFENFGDTKKPKCIWLIQSYNFFKRDNIGLMNKFVAFCFSWQEYLRNQLLNIC